MLSLQNKAAQSLNRIRGILWEWHRLMENDDYKGVEDLERRMHRVFKSDVALLDKYLTGNDRHGPYDDKYIKELLLDGSSFEVYLSDGGYSRIVFHAPVEKSDATDHLERSLSRPRVIERWDAIA